MLIYLKKVINHSIVYGASNSLLAILGLILLPIYARFFTPEEYGIFATINISGAILAIIYDLGLIAAINRWYFDYTQLEESKRKMMVSTILIFYLLSSSIPTIFLIYFSHEISGLIFKGQYLYSSLIQFMILTTYINLLIGIPLTVLRLQEKAVLYMTVSVLRGIGIVFITILYLFILKEGLLGLYKGNLIVALMVSIIAFSLTYNNYILGFSFSEMKKMLSYGLTYLPTILFMWTINFSDRYFLNYYSSLEDVGIYSFGYKIAQIVYIVVLAFSLGWTPILFSIIKENNGKEILSKIMTYYLLILISLVLLISLFSREIVAIVAVGKYTESYKIIPIISVSYLLYGIYIFLFSGLMVTKKIKSQPIIIGGSALINISLNIIMIPKFGYMGAALSTLFTYCVVVIGTYVVSQKHYYISYEMIRLFKITAAAISIYFMHYYKIFNYAMLAGIFGNLVLFMLFFYILYILRFFDLTEINKIKSIFRPVILKGI